MFGDELKAGLIGRIDATDQDRFDKLSYDLTKIANPALDVTQLFTIDSKDGTLENKPGLDPGYYSFNVSVGDGKFISLGHVEVVVNQVSDTMVKSAVIVRLPRISPEEFILKQKRPFLIALRSSLKARVKDIYILSVQPAFELSRSSRDTQNYQPWNEYNAKKQSSYPSVDVLFAIEKSPGRFYPRNWLRKQLVKHLKHLEAASGLRNMRIIEDMCTNADCNNGVCVDTMELDEKVTVKITTKMSSYITPQHHHIWICECNVGYTGKLQIQQTLT